MKKSVIGFAILMLIMNVARAETLGSSTTKVYDDSDVVAHDNPNAAHVLRTDSDYDNAGDDAKVIQARGFGFGGGMGGIRGTGDGRVGGEIAHREGWPTARPVERFQPERRFEGRGFEGRRFEGERMWHRPEWRPRWFGAGLVLGAFIIGAEMRAHRGQWVCRAVPSGGGEVIVEYGASAEEAADMMYSGCGSVGGEPACYIPNMQEDCVYIN